METLERTVTKKGKKMKKIKLVSASAAVVALALLVTGCGEQASPTPGGKPSGELQVVHVGQVVLPIFAPLYVAEAKGYFKDEGILLDLQSVKSGQDAVPLASSGALDVVVAGFSAGMFNAIHSGLNIKVVGSMGVSDGNKDKSPTDLIVSKKSFDSGAVKSIAGLKGKKIGVAGGVGSTGGYLLALALQNAGLGLKDVTIVNLGNPDIPTAIANGGLDAGLSSAPFSSNAIKDGTAVSLWVPPKGTSGTGVIYGGKFAQTPLAQKFFTALAKGAKDLQNGKGYDLANLNIIAKATNQTPDHLKAVPLYTWLPNLAPLPAQLQGMEKVWMQAGAIQYKDQIPAGKYIDGSFAEKAK
ncbi:MAG: ABC transporter substrate-binding protein [Lacisediminihabitans sp.]